MSLPITRIDDPKTLEKSITELKYLGEGSFGCVLRGKYKGESRIIKVIRDDSDTTAAAIENIREGFIGQQIKNHLSKPISDFFVCTVEVIIAPKDIPQAWRHMIDVHCENILNKVEVIGKVKNVTRAVKFFVVIQEMASAYGNLAQDASKWLASQKGTISQDIIRSIMFQLTLAFSHAQATIGFQHNDLKMDNLMFVEVDKGKTETYQLEDRDVFEIPLAGIVVRIIDFGGASLNLDPDEHNGYEYFKTPLIMTASMYPFDITMCTDIDQGILDRENDSDTSLFFRIMLALMCHNRPCIGDGKVWTFEFKENALKKYQGTDILFQNPLLEEYLPKDIAEPVVKAYNRAFPALAAKSPNYRFDVMKLGLTFIAFYHAFAPEFFSIEQRLNPDPTPNNTYIYENFPKLKDLDIGKAKNCFTALPDSLAVEYSREALHFLKVLSAPHSHMRYSFGKVPEPFHYHGLANALYHPFLAFDTWKSDDKGISLRVTDALSEPLLYSETNDSKYQIQLIFEDLAATLAAFESEYTGKPQPGSVPDDSSDASDDTSLNPAAVVLTKSNWTVDQAKLLTVQGASAITLDEIWNWTNEIVEALNGLEVVKIILSTLKVATVNRFKEPGGKAKIKELIAAHKKALAETQQAAENGQEKGKKKTEAAKKGKKKTEAAKKGKKKGNTSAKSAILEDIEHQLEYCDGAYNEELIARDLYEPLQSALQEHPALKEVADHLQLDAPLFANQEGYDMSDHATRTRYLHTLSVVAEMVETGDVTAEKISRCFVEWPALQQVEYDYKMGQVNEV